MTATNTNTVQLGPATVNLKGVRARDKNLISITISHDGVPVDLTGQMAQAQARKKATDALPALTAVVDIVDPAAGKMTLAWPGDDVAALLGTSAGWVGVWDLEIGWPTGEVQTILAGTFEAVMDVTRP
jgi:hypothetical protein